MTQLGSLSFHGKGGVGSTYFTQDFVALVIANRRPDTHLEDQKYPHRQNGTGWPGKGRQEHSENALEPSTPSKGCGPFPCTPVIGGLSWRPLGKATIPARATSPSLDVGSILSSLVCTSGPIVFGSKPIILQSCSDAQASQSADPKKP